MYFLNAHYFLAHETMNRAEFISPKYFSDGFDYLIAVTHRWSKPLNPDIGSLNFLEIRNMIRTLIESNKLSDSQIERIAIFYDYSSIYQSKKEDDLVLFGVFLQLHGSSKSYDTKEFLKFAASMRRQDLDRLYPMLLCADEVYMSKHHQKDYYTRCWCLVEALAGHLRRTLLDRAGPYYTPENLRYYKEFLALTDRLDKNLNDNNAILAFQDLVRHASCTVEEDRELTASYVPEIIDRVKQYRRDQKSLKKDVEHLQEVILSEKRSAVRISQR
jgi:hypothetical protein